MLWNAYSPLLSVVAERSPCVPVLSRVSCAPAITAPLESCTVPRMLPNVDCADARPASTKARQTTSETRPKTRTERKLVILKTFHQKFARAAEAVRLTGSDYLNVIDFLRKIPPFVTC